jgi:uncharacterized membrane protein
LLPVGFYYYSATFSGNANYAGSSATGGNFGIGQAPTVTSLVSSQNPSVQGQPVTFTASVSVAPGLLTGAALSGTVAFYVDGTSLGSATVVNGTASITDSSLVATNQAQNVTAVYSGDQDYSGSQGSLAQTVTT